MSKELRLDHHFDCAAADYWSRVYFDPDFTRALYLEGLHMGSAEITSDQTAANGSRTRVLEVRMPPLDLPAPVAKLIKGATIGYRETAVFDPARSETVLTTRFDQLSDRLAMSTRIRVEPAGERRCRRQTTINLDAHIFGLAGVVERVMEKIVRDNWEAGTRYTHTWMARAGSFT